MAETPTYEKGKLYQIPIIDFKPDPNQPRKVIDPDALAELVASITKFGILQPLLFRADPTLYIVAGERRYQAAQQVGLTTLPAIFVEGNPSEIALVENLLRQDLTSVEEAEALQRLKDEQQYSDEQLSGVIGKARTTVSDIMLINRLPAAIRDECRGDHKIGKNVLIEIARKKQERGMLTAWDTYKDKRDKAPAGRQKRDPNNQAQALDALVKTAAKISEIDNSAWTDDEKEAYRAALVNLQTAIESFLNPASKTF